MGFVGTGRGREAAAGGGVKEGGVYFILRSWADSGGRMEWSDHRPYFATADSRWSQLPRGPGVAADRKPYEGFPRVAVPPFDRTNLDATPTLIYWPMLNPLLPPPHTGKGR